MMREEELNSERLSTPQTDVPHCTARYTQRTALQQEYSTVLLDPAFWLRLPALVSHLEFTTGV